MTNDLQLKAKKRSIFKIEFNRIQAFFVVFIIFLIGYFAIFRANVNYVDDIGRTFYGYRIWRDYNRYVNEWLSLFLGGSTKLADISPLWQIIALAINAFVCNIIIFDVYPRKKCKIMDIVASTVFGFYPYYLENMAYKFDSIFMALSVLFSVLPIYIYQNYSRNKRRENVLYVLTTALSIFLVFNSYQVAAGIFPMICLAYCMFMYLNGEKNKDIFKFLMISIGGYLIGIFGYFIESVIHPMSETYVSVSVKFNKNMINVIINNYKTYLRDIKADFRKVWLILIGINTIYYVIINTIKSKKNKLATFIIALIVTAIMFILSFGIYPLLERPLFAPRAMYATGIFLAIVMVGITYYTTRNFESNNGLKNIMYNFQLVLIYLSIIGLCWCFLTLTVIFGNTLAAQKEYEAVKINALYSDLNELNLSKNETYYLTVYGNIGRAHVSGYYYKIMEKLVYVNIKQYWGWAPIQLNYNDFNIAQATEDISNMKFETVKDTTFYTIQMCENYMIIIFK